MKFVYMISILLVLGILCISFETILVKSLLSSQINSLKSAEKLKKPVKEINETESNSLLLVYLFLIESTPFLIAVSFSLTEKPISASYKEWLIDNPLKNFKSIPGKNIYEKIKNLIKVSNYCEKTEISILSLNSDYILLTAGSSVFFFFLNCPLSILLLSVLAFLSILLFIFTYTLLIELNTLLLENRTDKLLEDIKKNLGKIYANKNFKKIFETRKELLRKTEKNISTEFQLIYLYYLSSKLALDLDS